MDGDRRWTILTRLLKLFLCCVLVLTVVLNIAFITYFAKSQQGDGEDGENFFPGTKQGIFQKNRMNLVSELGVQADKTKGTEQQWTNEAEQRRRTNSRLLPKAGDEKWITVEAHSDRKTLYVSVDGKPVYEKIEKETDRGLHCVVLNQHNGKMVATRLFDTLFLNVDKDIAAFLESLQDERIVVFIVKDEASLHLKKAGRDAIRSLGSRLVDSLDWRDSWVFIGKKEGSFVAEDIRSPPQPDKWPSPAKMQVSLMLTPNSDACEYGTDDEGKRRREFCENYDGYGHLCKCTNFDSIDLKAKQLYNNRLSDIPVAVIASNRPTGLYRMLRKLLSANGVYRNMITVYIDGFHPEPAAVAKLFKIRSIQRKSVCSKVCRIQQHYKKSLTQTFDEYPNAPAMIILEEDLEVSTDIFDYFSQTFPLLETDPSLFCISAWNDQGYKHAVKDPTAIYRVGTMPGLGWILKRSIYKNEIEGQWPGPTEDLDWDIWMRRNEIMKGRECIIPEISRTFHFGSTGTHMNRITQHVYFENRALNSATSIKFDVERTRRDNYEKEMHMIIRDAKVLDHSKNQCHNKEDFIPDTKGKTYVGYFKLDKEKENETHVDTFKRYVSWMSLAGCFDMWDLDPRVFHHGVVRFWYKDNRILFVGVPDSLYSIHKPTNVKPIYIPNQEPRHTRLIT